jgi:malonyl-CoA O-methyltransferase
MNLRKDFSGAAASYDSAAVLAREVGRRMATRLDFVRLTPQCVADIGCATGDGVRELQRRYPKALPLAVDFARPMLAAVQTHAGWWMRTRGLAPRCLNADVCALPLADASLDLVWSNLMLHWLPDVRPAFAELHRVLDTGGLLQFAMLGPDTLKELRVARQKVGAGNTASCAASCATSCAMPAFLDMHDIGDMLAAAGFADPVMEMETLTLTYTSVRRFLADQRHLGVRNSLLGQLPWQQWRQVFAAWEREDGLLPARFEIIYGHAWKPAPRLAEDGRAIVRFHKP